MLLVLLVACSQKPDDTGPFTSDLRAELAGPGTSTCEDDELTLQIGFLNEVPRVEAEVHDGSDVVERFDMPFSGMDEDTGTIFVHELSLATEADEADASHTTFSCDDVPYPGFRMYDDEGGIMGCYFGEFVEQEFDRTGCPEE